MKKKLISVLAGVLLLAGCGCAEEKETVHWSHKACVSEIVAEQGLEDYTYTAKQIEHDEEHGDDETYCFDITVKSGETTYRYCCYAVVDDGEVMFVDCDRWFD